MTETIPDIEQVLATHAGSTDGAEKTRPSNSNVKADEAKPENVKAEKVVILSFRGLQLRRIAELQNELVQLSSLTATGMTATGAALPDATKAP
jgi:hypothetical protein